MTPSASAAPRPASTPTPCTARPRIHSIDTARIQDELARDRLVVVAGFQGVDQDSDVTTLGRGGSDTTAVALAAALSADRCDIYTDVEGIYTADPRIVPEARKMTEIGYEEMLELASYGAKMSPRSIELGAVYGVPIYVASSFGDSPGTLIHQEAGTQPMENRIKVTGIAHNSNVAKITLRAVPDRPGIAAALFEPLAQTGVSVDTIVQNTSADRNHRHQLHDHPQRPAPGPGANGRHRRRAGRRRNRQRLNPGPPSASSAPACRTPPGYASRMFRTLADAKINIDMITTSEIRISCIIREDQAAEAVRVLHRHFQLDQPE